MKQNYTVRAIIDFIKLSDLREPEKHTIIRRLEGATRREIGEELSLTYERIRQIESKGLRKLHYRINKLRGLPYEPKLKP